MSVEVSSPAPGGRVATRAIDCDVHCSLPSIETLFPYLPEQWPEYIRNAGFAGSTALTSNYPPGAPTTATAEARAHGAPPGSSLEALQRHVLDRWDMSLAILNCMTGFESIRNLYFGADLIRATNDWVVREWLDRDPRLRASLLVSTLDPPAAIEEIERLGGDPRFVQVLLPIRSEAPYGNKRYHGVYEAAIRHGLVIGLHAWGMSGLAPTPNGFPQYYMEDYLGNIGIVQTHLVSMVAEGVFGRFPDIRVTALECGFAWLPSLLWRVDKDWKGVHREVPWVVRRPSAYLREHLRITLAPAHASAAQAAALLRFGLPPWSELPLYASDYPHEHGDGAAALLEALEPSARDAVLWENAATFYDLGPSA